MREVTPPEEKLLRLIRGSRKRRTAVVQGDFPAAGSPEAAGARQAWKPSFFRRHITGIGLPQIVRWGLIFSFLYLVIVLAYPWFGLKKFRMPSGADLSAAYPELMPYSAAKPVEFYLDGAGARQIFGEASAAGSGLPQAAAGVNVADDINLVGIISGENPQAIIEDKKSSKTYYLSRGQLIGDLRIDDIGDGKIVVERMGQKFELYL